MLNGKGEKNFSSINGTETEQSPLLTVKREDTNPAEAPNDHNTLKLKNARVQQASRYTAAAFTLAVDLALTLALYFSAGTSMNSEKEYLEMSVVNFEFHISTFDIFMLAVARVLIVFPLVWNVLYLESMLWWIVANLLTSTSFVYAFVKIFVVNLGGEADKYAEKPWTNVLISFSIIFTAAEAYQLFTVKSFIKQVYISSDAVPSEATTEKPKKKTADINRLMKLALTEWYILTWAMVGLFLNSLANLILPYVFGIIVNALVDEDAEDARKQLTDTTILMILIFAFASLCGFVRSWLFTLAGHRIVATLRKGVFRSVINQEVAFFDQTRTGEITSRLSSDCQVIQNAVTTNISMLVRYIVQIIGSLSFLFILSWQLSLVMFATVPLVAIGAVAYGRYIQALQKSFQDELAQATNVAEEVISNVRTVRSFSKERRSAGNYGDAIHKTYLVGVKLALIIGLFQGVIGFIPLAAISLILWYGGVLVINGQLDVGLLTSFMIYTLSVAMAFAFLSSLFGDFMAAVGASERLFELIDRKPKISTSGGTIIDSFRGQVEFDNVTFSYPARDDQVVLKKVSLHLEPGKVLALVGPSGGGKSTIVSLMERFYDVSEGTIKVDGVDVREVDPEWYRSNVALVSQEPVLFATSIRENICFALDREVSQEEVEAAARAANAHDFITSFTEGYDTQVGERGVRLSGGQKQRIAISRALLMNPKILLLDEATSALDSESEYLVQDAIDKAMKNRTVLVIAHRLSTVRNADAIAVLSGGSVVELGTHDELLGKGGLYKKLVTRQLQGSDLKSAFVEAAAEETAEVDA